jgi:hypothetical protein
MRQLKIFNEVLLEKLHKGLLALDRKQCRQVTGLTGCYTWRWHLHVMGLSDNAICRKCGQEEESSYHICYQCPALAGHGMKIFGSVCLELTDIGTSSIKQVSATALENRALLKDHTVDPAVASVPGVTRVCPHVRYQYSIHQNQNTKYRKFLHEVGRM